MTGYSNQFAFVSDTPVKCAACKIPIQPGTVARWRYDQGRPRRMIHDTCSPAPPVPIENDPVSR